jgi:uncharacterized membrane protein YcaP (DUF421 family)
MEKSQIKITDLYRILVGDVPFEYYAELLLRSVFIYLLLMICMRLLGKRMASRLGRNELIALVTLAATIGIPLTAPERGLLPPVIIAVLVVYISRWIAARSFRDIKFESFSQGHIDTIVQNGVMDLNIMKKVRLTRERLVGQLRQGGVKHLGEVKRLYMEANGGFSLVKQDEPLPGLFIIPRWDDELYNRLQKAESEMACENCGFIKQQSFDTKTFKCTSCGHIAWTPAVLSN